MVKVFFRNFGGVYYAKIIPIKMLPYTPHTCYEGELPNDEIREVVNPIWLTSIARQDVEFCLRLQGLDPWNYITLSTVHGPWKAKKHQGIIYSVSKVNLTHLTNPNKPFPSRIECNKFFEKLIANNFNRSNP